MIKQLAHLCINTQDMVATKRFYLDALGLEKGFAFYKKKELFGFYIKFGNGTFVEIFKGEPGAVGNINHFAIEVDDIDGMIARVKAHGFEIGEKKLGVDHSWQVWTTDPNGVRIEFHEYTEKSLQIHGGECEVDW